MKPITISTAELERLLGAASPDAALVFLYMRSSGCTDSEQAAHALHMSDTRVVQSKDLLTQLGLLSQSVLPALEKESPAYTEQDVTGFLKRDNAFRLLVGEAQTRLGRVQSTESLKILLAIYDYLGLPTEVIGLLIGYCISRAQARGNTNPPTMRTIEREAAVWARQGITTVALASAYMQKQNGQLTRFGRFRKILGLTGKLSTAEERYLFSWVEMGFSEDAIELAYERTRLSTGTLKWSYMNKILQDWHAQGLHTAELARTEIRPAAAGTGRQNTGRRNVGTGRESAWQKQPGQYEREAVEQLKQWDRLEEK